MMFVCSVDEEEPSDEIIERGNYLVLDRFGDSYKERRVRFELNPEFITYEFEDSVH